MIRKFVKELLESMFGYEVLVDYGREFAYFINKQKRKIFVMIPEDITFSELYSLVEVLENEIVSKQ